MMRQTKVTLKTASAALTYAEMGDIVCNSSSAITLALPTVSPGLWYRVSNVGSGAVTVGDITINQGEQGLCVGASVWYFSKGGGGTLTKEQIEEVLTGEIDSHSHAAPSLNFTDLEDTPNSYTGLQGAFPRVNSTESGIELVTVPPGSGASKFTELSDAPSSFAGQAGKIIAVNSGETALEFIIPSSGGSGGTQKDRIYVPYGTASAYDDEFDDGVIDGNWIAVDTPSYENTYYEPSGLKGISALVPSGKGGMKINGLLKSIGLLSPPFYIETAVGCFSRDQNYPTVGLIFADGVNYGAGTQIVTGPVIPGNRMNRSMTTGFNARSSYSEANMLGNGRCPWLFLRFVYKAANTFNVLASPDGVVWTDFFGDITYNITPTHFGIMETTFDKSDLPLACHWKYFRVREGLSANG